MSASTKPCRLSASSDRRGEQETGHAPAEPGRERPRDEQPLERDHRERVRGTVAIAPHQLGASEGDDHHVGGPGDDEPEGGAGRADDGERGRRCRRRDERDLELS